MTDTVKRTSADGHVAETPPRDQLVTVQTPQAFRFKPLLEAHEAAESALRYAQDEVLGVAASNWDKKIPTATDCTDSGICPTKSAASWHAVPAGKYDATRLAAPPEYWIEYLGTGPGYKGSCDTDPPSIDCRSPMFRITARSQASGRADVMLQSVISSRIPTPGT